MDNEQLATFRKQDAVIADMATQYMPLTINGIDDRKGFADVHEARMIVMDAVDTLEGFGMEKLQEKTNENK